VAEVVAFRRKSDVPETSALVKRSEKASRRLGNAYSGARMAWAERVWRKGLATAPDLLRDILDNDFIGGSGVSRTGRGREVSAGGSEEVRM
jgi:hypothetical protein